jgi:hypothetical protein
MHENEFLRNLRYQAEQNPALAATIIIGAITAISRLKNANSEARNSRSWAREVRRRERQERRQGK